LLRRLDIAGRDDRPIADASREAGEGAGGHGLWTLKNLASASVSGRATGRETALVGC
jgi:hypothetical protein